MKWVFDWHGQDSRATGPLDVGCTVTQTYGAGGGKCALVQTDISATLATHNDQTVFAPL